MFESTRPFTLFDYFRVPYDRVLDVAGSGPGIAALGLRATGARLSWPTEETLVAGRGRASAFFAGSTPLFGHVARDADVRTWLRGAGGNWRSVRQVRAEGGTQIGDVWEEDDGSTFLPFDPNELISNFWTERYLKFFRSPFADRVATVARRGYYRARPLVPRNVQIGARRSFSRVQSRSRFPRWPIETALHDFYDLLFAAVARVADRPVPFIGAWPRDRTWALVLTHDVEGQTGYDNLRKLLQVELDAGYRSSWNFVPQNRYVVEDDLVEELRSAGFEIGVHGLFHDGRDLASAATLRRRLPAIRSYASRWKAKGFRSPGTLRSVELMPLLEFDYDSSYADTAPFEPQPGGSCSWLPYMIEDLVELPITLEQDHTLFHLLGHRDERIWVEKAQFLRERGGMALALTHSDYVGNADLLRSYRRLLEKFAEDASAWKALPGDVSDWWRRRSQSTLQALDGEWNVVGPAQGDARVEFAAPEALAV